jgi:hypothetical protein
MTITVAHLTIDLSCDCKAPLLGNEREVHINRIRITCWGIYLDNKHISYTYGKEPDEKTKVWIEKWLKDRL